MEQTLTTTIPVETIDPEVLLFSIEDLLIPCYHFGIGRKVWIKSTLEASYTFYEEEKCGFKMAQIFDIPPGAHFLLAGNLYQRVMSQKAISEKN